MWGENSWAPGEGHVLGGNQVSMKVTEGQSSERRWKAIAGMLFIEEEFKRQEEWMGSWWGLGVFRAVRGEEQW